MARHHATPEGNVPFTAEEETARDAEEAKWKAEKPMNDWVESIQLSDSTMLPRWGEDILDRDGTDGLPQVVIDRYNAKKALRATKP